MKMKEDILILDGFIPDNICKELCELFDESEEFQDERQFVRGENTNAIYLDFKNMIGRSKKSRRWSNLTKEVGKASLMIYKQWCEKTQHQKQNVKVGIPKIYRYDPVFGKHKMEESENDNVNVFMYLNDCKAPLTIGTNKIQSQSGRVVMFPSKYESNDSSDKKYMKYAIKFPLIKK